MISSDIADSLNKALTAMAIAINDVQAIGGLPSFRTKVSPVFCGSKINLFSVRPMCFSKVDPNLHFNACVQLAIVH